MYKALVFAGTTEGYAIAEYLSKRGVMTEVQVATEYGSHALQESDTLHIHAKRLTAEEMETYMKACSPDLVIDATHPYAAMVTENIFAACSAAKYPYLRCLREAGEKEKNAVYVENIEEAVEFLSKTEGRILVTTGSKELKSFVKLPDYQQRVFARVLSLPQVVLKCSELGIEGQHLICMQGPFSKEMNEAMLKQYQCRYLVTKDTGKAGGFQEKAEAAKACGATLVIIGRPLQETGYTLQESKRYLTKLWNLPLYQKVSLVGIGMGSREGMTIEAEQTLKEADLIIGAKRMVEAAAKDGQAVLIEYRSTEIIDYIQTHPEYEKIAIVLSGDVGFYSGAKKLIEKLPDPPKIVSGISSAAAFMGKIGFSWDDAKIVSAHGRNCNLISWIQREKKVFSILGTSDGVKNLAQKLVQYHMGEIMIYVGENLSYPDEKIISAKAKELVTYEGTPLSVVCVVNPMCQKVEATHGLSDEVFLRGKAPMTKAEVRAVSLAKLRLHEDSICYDVGAGTGSVSIEMALRAHQGKVYAIEKKPDAIALLKENKEKFAADHVTIVEGSAPEAMEILEPPTHVFIGGSSGNMRSILELVFAKNPDARIVMNAITLETIAEIMQLIKEWDLQAEIISLSVARAKSIASYHMMMGENPIYIVTCQRSKDENT